MDVQIPFHTQTIIPAWKSCVETFLAYNFYTFGHLPDLNDIALEGLIHKAMKSQREDATWVKGGHLPWDLSLPESNLKFQVKGTLVHGKTMHLSSFRLGTHSTSRDSLKEGILKMVKANDVWYVVTRQVEDPLSMKVSFFECDQRSFLYDESLYDFEEITTKKRTYFQKKVNEVTARVTPSTSHQLWYLMNFEKFKGMPGVSLVDETTFKVKDLPTVIYLN